MSQIKFSQNAASDYSRTSPRRRLSTRVAVPVAALVAAVVGIVGTAIVSAVAHAAGVSDTFTPLQSSAYVGLIVVAVLAGVLGWQLVRTRSRNPRELLRRLVPLVVLASFTPDIVIGVTGAEHATWGGVVALMCAHVVVALSIVASYSLFLPARSSKN